MKELTILSIALDKDTMLALEKYQKFLQENINVKGITLNVTAAVIIKQFLENNVIPEEYKYGI